MKYSERSLHGEANISKSPKVQRAKGAESEEIQHINGSSCRGECVTFSPMGGSSSPTWGEKHKLSTEGVVITGFLRRWRSWRLLHPCNLTSNTNQPNQLVSLSKVNVATCSCLCFFFMYLFTKEICYTTHFLCHHTSNLNFSSFFNLVSCVLSLCKYNRFKHSPIQERENRSNAIFFFFVTLYFLIFSLRLEQRQDSSKQC